MTTATTRPRGEALQFRPTWTAPRSAAMAAILVSFLTPACASTAQRYERLSIPDESLYATEVHPMLERSCATLDCHGAPGRPFRLYAETGLRAQDDLRDQPLTAEELRDNALALIAIDPEPSSIDDHIALLKPLFVASGGVHHAEADLGELWENRVAPPYLCLRSWLAGEAQTPAAHATCTQAAP